MGDISKKRKLESIVKIPQDQNFVRKTDDGFTIKDHVPEDDSDISDGFGSDEEECFSSGNATILKSKNETEDGFKIMSTIPNDDSDISDAFESDLDEEEWFQDKKNNCKKTELLTQDSKNGKPKINSFQHSIPCLPTRNIKKPLRNIMDDFGLNDSNTFDKNKVKSISNIKNVSNTTLAGSLRKLPSVDVIDYSHRRRNKNSKSKKADEDLSKSEQNLKSFIKVSRHDIYKLGMDGLGDKKKDAKIALAIKLGAKPMKKKAMNYKLYQVERKKTDIIVKEEREMKRHQGFKVKKPVLEKKKKSDNVSSGLSMGKFKDGVLKLSKSDIKRIKK